MTTTERPDPWAVGQRPGVRITDPGLSDDLKLLVGQHGNVADALRAAVRQAAAIARGELLTAPGHGPIRADLDMIARAGLTDPSDAIRWAVDHAAAEVYARWTAGGQLPTLTPLDAALTDTTEEPSR